MDVSGRRHRSARDVEKRRSRVSVPEIADFNIARRGKALGIDYSQTWSCYKGGEKHCGKCGTCVERREAFAEAAIEDKTEYED